MGKLKKPIRPNVTRKKTPAAVPAPVNLATANKKLKNIHKTNPIAENTKPHKTGLNSAHQT
jgi:hypothetical protein